MQKQYQCMCVRACVCVWQKKKTNKQRARSVYACVFLFVCLYVYAKQNATQTRTVILRTCLTVSSIRCAVLRFATTPCASPCSAVIVIAALRRRRRRRWRRWRQRRRPGTGTGTGRGTNKTHSKFVSAQKFSASSLIVQRLATVSRVASANKKLGQRSRQRRRQRRQRRWQQRA